MKYINGSRISISEVDHHRWVEDIVYFDGPLLSLLKGSTTQDYFYYWVDSDSRCNRWLGIAVSRSSINLYKNAKKSVLDLLKENENVFVIDIDFEFKRKKAWLLNVDKLVEGYIPSENSYFDPDLSPAGANILADPEEYRIKLDGDWFLDDLVRLPRIYNRLYTFIYTLSNLSKESVSINAKNIFSRYPWRGGFSTDNFFRDLDKVIPSLHEPQVKEITYASPGHIKLELLVEVSNKLEQILSEATNNFDNLDCLYKEILKYNREKEFSKIDVEDIKFSLDSKTRKELEVKFDDFSNELGLHIYSDDIKKLAGNRLIAIKILLSYFRIIKKFIVYHQKGMVSF